MNVVQSLDKGRIRSGFERAAPTYDGAAVVQRYMADELIQRLEVVNMTPRRILDVGCGTGYAARGLAKRFPEARLIFLDIAPAMLRQTRRKVAAASALVCADAAALPIAAQSVDIVFCNAVMPWCALERTCAEFARVLRPNGLLTFSTFGPDTLYELRRAWRQVDDRVHVHDFVDMHNIGDVLMQCGLSGPVMDVDYLTVTHREFADAMRDLKDLGVTNASSARHRGLTGKGRIEAVRRAWETRRNQEGLLCTSYEIIYGHAWAPQMRQHPADGTVVIPLNHIQRPRDA